MERQGAQRGRMDTTLVAWVVSQSGASLPYHSLPTSVLLPRDLTITPFSTRVVYRGEAKPLRVDPITAVCAPALDKPLRQCVCGAWWYDCASSVRSQVLRSQTAIPPTVSTVSSAQHTAAGSIRGTKPHAREERDHVNTVVFLRSAPRFPSAFTCSCTYSADCRSRVETHVGAIHERARPHACYEPRRIRD